MTNLQSEKEEAIEVIQRHLEHWERLYRDHICEERDGEETIRAFVVAIETLKYKLHEERSIKRSTDLISRQTALDIFDDFEVSVERGEHAYSFYRNELATAPSPEVALMDNSTLAIAAMATEWREKFLKDLDDAIVTKEDKKSELERRQNNRETEKSHKRYDGV